MSLVHFLTLAALVWMSTRRDLSKPVVPLLVALTLIASYKESYLWDSFWYIQYDTHRTENVDIKIVSSKSICLINDNVSVCIWVIIS